MLIFLPVKTPNFIHFIVILHKRNLKTYTFIVFSLCNFLCDLHEAAVSASWNTATLVELVNNELEAKRREEIVD